MHSLAYCGVAGVPTWSSWEQLSRDTRRRACQSNSISCGARHYTSCVLQKFSSEAYSRTSNLRRAPGRCQATLLDALAFVPGVCFDRQCQEAADRAFLIVTAVPLLGLLVAIILRFRPASSEQLGNDQVDCACVCIPHCTLTTLPMPLWPCPWLTSHLTTGFALSLINCNAGL